MTTCPTTLKVLLVEDNAGDADLVREYLSEPVGAGCRLTHAADLASAAARLRAEPFDAVLLDLSLPDSHGLETVRRAAAAAEGVPVVVLTGSDDDEQGAAAVREGAQDYLAKRELSARALVRSLRHALERRRAEEALRLAEERLREAERVEAIGRLAGGVAHEINNGMTVVQCYADLLLDRLTGEQTAEREYVGEIGKAAERAATITRQLLSYSRRQMLRPTVFDLYPFVEKLGKMLRPLLPEVVELTTLLDPDLGPVRADPSQVEQVVRNLVQNAGDALPNGGRVTLWTRKAELTGEADGEPRPYALLAVSDDGPGLTAEARAHLFEPFFSTKPMGKGLGLATAYGIVKQSDGHIEVESEAGRGTTVKVYLPWLSVAEPEPSARALVAR